MKTFCFRNGVIGFARKTPPGAIQIASGPARKLRQVITVCARHGYEPGVLLVPGVPEAELRATDPLVALRSFQEWVNRRISQ